MPEDEGVRVGGVLGESGHQVPVLCGVPPSFFLRWGGVWGLSSVRKALETGQCGGQSRDALEGGNSPPPPGRPAIVSLTASASLHGICNRQ